jgi:hypothetical protein
VWDAESRESAVARECQERSLALLGLAGTKIWQDSRLGFGLLWRDLRLGGEALSEQDATLEHRWFCGDGMPKNLSRLFIGRRSPLFEAHPRQTLAIPTSSVLSLEPTQARAITGTGHPPSRRKLTSQGLRPATCFAHHVPPIAHFEERSTHPRPRCCPRCPRPRSGQVKRARRSIHHWQVLCLTSSQTVSHIFLCCTPQIRPSSAPRTSIRPRARRTPPASSPQSGSPPLCSPAMPRPTRSGPRSSPRCPPTSCPRAPATRPL